MRQEDLPEQAGGHYRPFSEACENNKAPILAVLRQVFADASQVLEIGSGTGQHAVHFARHLPHLFWQPTDREENLAGIASWCEYAALENLRQPLLLDVQAGPWPVSPADAVFSANTAHIMGWPAVEAMFAGIARQLPAGGAFCLYGPFNYHGQYTSESNLRFDRWLKARSCHSGLRDVDDLRALGARVGLTLVEDHEMPVNNRLLEWRRV